MKARGRGREVAVRIRGVEGAPEASGGPFFTLSAVFGPVTLLACFSGSGTGVLRGQVFPGWLDLKGS